MVRSSGTQLLTAGLGETIAGKSLLVIAGSGGVGKTTVSASLGLAAAQQLDGDVLVLTIDPARRLAAALGIDIDGNEAVNVAVPGKRTSNLYAAMLDPGPAWDAMIETEATPEIAERILNNSVYRRIADTFVHGNDYAALGWLDAAIESERYRLIIVDTPPSQNALDFFDAPARVSEFFGSSLLGWLFAVTAPSSDVVAKLDRLAESLASRDLTFDGVVVNGVEPDVFWDPKVHDVATRVATDTKSPLTVSGTALLGPGAEYVIERCEVAAAGPEPFGSVAKWLHRSRSLDKLPGSTTLPSSTCSD